MAVLSGPGNCDALQSPSPPSYLGQGRDGLQCIGPTCCACDVTWWRWLTNAWVVIDVQSGKELAWHHTSDRVLRSDDETPPYVEHLRDVGGWPLVRLMGWYVYSPGGFLRFSWWVFTLQIMDITKYTRYTYQQLDPLHLIVFTFTLLVYLHNWYVFFFYLIIFTSSWASPFNQFLLTPAPFTSPWGTHTLTYYEYSLHLPWLSFYYTTITVFSVYLLVLELTGSLYTHRLL